MAVVRSNASGGGVIQCVIPVICKYLMSGCQAGIDRIEFAGLRLFEAHYQPTPVNIQNYDVSSDGQRFLMLKPVEVAGATQTQINVVLNWFEELKQKVPVGTK